MDKKFTSEEKADAPKSKFRHFYAENNASAHEDDGTTMIRIIFSKCDPSAKSGINSLKAELSSFALGDYEENVPEILDAMQICCNQIIHCGGQDDDFVPKAFDALGASDNEDFLSFVKKKRDLWEADELDDDALVLASTKKHDNLSKGKSKKKVSKVTSDDQDTKFVALLAKVIPLLLNTCTTNTKDERKNSSNGNDYYENGDNRNRNGPAFRKTEPCRLARVGDSAAKRRRTLHWHLEHDDGKGVCLAHKPEHHGAWQQRKTCQRAEKLASKDLTSNMRNS